MAKVTSKLQVTLPKALAERYRVAPGDDIAWEAAGDIIRVIPPRRPAVRDVAARLRVFDQATARQRIRNKNLARTTASERGWTRDELYDRGGPR
jgi:antitoxin component of MazEF toxin-antitoxin module